MLVTCPHCNGGLENRPDIAGTVASCPHCRRQLSMPAWQELVIPQGQVANTQSPSIFIQNSQPKQRPRLKSRGWFSNSAATAAGFFLVFAIFIVTMCGGAWYWTKYQVASGFKTMAVKAEKHSAKWRNFATNQLRQHGYVKASDDTTLVTIVEPNVIVGKCKDKANALHEFRIYVKVASFGEEENVEVLRITVDDEEVYKQP